MTSGPGLLLLHLLGTRTGRLGALRVQGVAADAALCDALPGSGLDALARQLPCRFDADTPAPLATVLASLGVTPLPAGALADADAHPGDTFAGTVEWLPGTWYLQPPGQAVSPPAASRAFALKLVQLVATDADTHEIEEVFRRDSSLSYHLLRLVNSVAMGLNRTVTSFSQAILLIGRQQLRRWLNFILFAARDDDPRSAMLLARVAVRARSMELLAKAAGLDRPQQDQAFMTGMFSLLSVLFGQPLETMLQPLKLGDALLAALLRREGVLGQLLQTVEAAETADAAQLLLRLQALGIAPEAYTPITIEAHRWMLDAVHDSGSPPHG